jgi:hypothetical protein
MIVPHPEDHNDLVAGVLQIGRGELSVERQFLCSTDFSTGSVRAARVQGFPEQPAAPAGPQRGARDVGALAMENCQTRIAGRIRGLGYRNVVFPVTEIDAPGSNVTGTATAAGNTPERRQFGFSCAVDPHRGRVKGTSVRKK